MLSDESELSLVGHLKAMRQAGLGHSTTAFPYCVRVTSNLGALSWKGVTGLILTSANLTEINTFQQPGKVSITNFKGAKKDGQKLIVDLPEKSVVTLELN